MGACAGKFAFWSARRRLLTCAELHTGTWGILVPRGHVNDGRRAASQYELTGSDGNGSETIRDRLSR